MVRKWYFCVSQSSLTREKHGWSDLIVSAVQSARKHTTLQPILVYDGESNDLTRMLEREGVTVVQHRVSFYDALAERDRISPGYLAIASGAFLRVEIPLIEQTDEFVLYTDCDVNFLGEPALDRFSPMYFAGAPQTSMSDYANDLNTGVLVFNVPRMREQLPSFTRFIIDNLYSGWPGCDQENYRRFFKGKWDNLPLELNWKPYWGINENARILHWHGPKPIAVSEKLRNPEAALPRDWKILIDHNPNAYRYFISALQSQEPPELNATLSEDVIGNIDGISDGVMYGWVLRRSDPKKTAQFVVSAGEETRCVVTGSEPRSDLLSLYHTQVGGFRVQLPSRVTGAPQAVLHFSDTRGKPLSIGFRGMKRGSIALRSGIPVRSPDEVVRISASPMMPPESSAYFIQLLKGASCYLEYGAGGSTLKAAEVKVPHTICVESDADWLMAVQRRLGTRSDAFSLLHADIGETKELGFPVSDRQWKKYHRYSIEPWRTAKEKGLTPDLVLVDGRFRVACCLASILMGKPGLRILFDDYADRSYYHEVEEYIKPARMIDRVAEFIVPHSTPRDELWTALLTAVTDPR